MHLVVEDGGALSRLVVEDVVGEGHARVVVVDGADAKLADVLVQRELVEAHRAHERDVRRLERKGEEEVESCRDEWTAHSVRIILEPD